MPEPLHPNAILTFAPKWRVERLDRARVFLIGEKEHQVLPDSRAAALAVLVDGQRTVQEVVAAAQPEVSELEALFVLGQLVRHGHLVLVDRTISPETADFWTASGIDAEVATRALEREPVSVTSVGGSDLTELMSQSLAQAGVRLSSEARIQVVVTNDYLVPELEEINAGALRTGNPWYLVQPTGIQPLIGPFLQPGRGPCWTCLAFYLRNNRPVEELVRLRRGQPEPVLPPRSGLDLTRRLACELGALAVARALIGMAASGEASSEIRELLALDLKSLRTDNHAVIRRPQCPVCGDPRLVASASELPIELRPVEKAPYEDGGYRRQTPRQSYEMCRHLVSPLTGPVTHLGPVPGRDTELRAVYASGYLVCPRENVPDTNQFDKVCLGKGRNADQAKMSALGEAIERFSGVFQGDEARIRASTEELGQQALPLDGLLNFSEEQYRSRHRPGAAKQPIPEPLHPQATIDWAPGWSLTANERRYVPFAYCYAEPPPEVGTAYCRPCGNGVAAGTCVEEAVLQGLLELIERDAVGIWWYNRIRRPAFDLDSFSDAYIDAIRSDYARLGWRIWVIDVTHDLRIPVCVALAHHEKEDRFSIGFGCHLEARLAIHRALTELNQLFDLDRSRKAPWDSLPGDGQDFLFGASNSTTTARSIASMNGANLREDIEVCIHQLHQAGLEVVVVNKTRPDLLLSVAQVVVPGLRHFWPRFGPGRLYSVPATLGWRSKPLAEPELNPVPLLL